MQILSIINAKTLDSGDLANFHGFSVSLTDIEKNYFEDALPGAVINSIQGG